MVMNMPDKSGENGNSQFLRGPGNFELLNFFSIKKTIENKNLIHSRKN